MKFERNKEGDKLKNLGLGKQPLIKGWLEKYDITDYRINDDMTIDVDMDVNLDYKLNDNLPEYIQFNKVRNWFAIRGCHLTSLRGCPFECSSLFCNNNELTSLQYSPIKIINFFNFSNNKITNFKYLKCGKNTSLNITVNPISELEIEKNKLAGYNIYL